MNTRILTAIFAVALVAIGGIGIGVALPGDVEYMKTSEERAVEFTADVADQKQDIYRAYEAGQISKYAMVTYVDALAFKLEARIEKYERMYNLLAGQIWSTDDASVQVGSEIWIGRTGVAMGTAEGFVVVPYMQRQVDAKVAELEADELNKSIDVTIVVTREMHTYPGGPVFYVYHFEVTWDIYEQLYE